jgi:hypothetical protein
MEMLFATTAKRALDPEYGVDFGQFGLILVRGASGSGKSTMAQKIKEQILCNIDSGPVKTFETDDFFVRDGVYKYEPAQLGYAHSRLQLDVRSSLYRGVICIVANTLTRDFELSPYFKMAAAMEGCGVCVVDMYTQFENLHGVPPEWVEKQKARFVPCDRLKVIPNMSIVGVKIYE